jgi:hypothetical protein
MDDVRLAYFRRHPYSSLMPDESLRTRTMRGVTAPTRWHPSDRRIWSIMLALSVATWTAAIFIPRLPWGSAIILYVLAAEWVTDRRRRKRQAAAAMSRDDLPADVISLIQAGKRIKAIQLYRDHTGLSLREAKNHIDAR